MVDGEKAPALRLETLLALGLDQRTAENALVNSKVTANIAAVIAEVRTLSVVVYALSNWTRAGGLCAR